LGNWRLFTSLFMGILVAPALLRVHPIASFYCCLYSAVYLVAPHVLHATCSLVPAAGSRIQYMLEYAVFLCVFVCY